MKYKINLCQLPSGDKFVLWGTEDYNELGIPFEDLGEIQNIMNYQDLPMINIDDLIQDLGSAGVKKIFGLKKTSDHRLREVGIDTYRKLYEEYLKVRMSISKQSRAVRQVVIKRYSEIANNLH